MLRKAKLLKTVVNKVKINPYIYIYIYINLITYHIYIYIYCHFAVTVCDSHPIRQNSQILTLIKQNKNYYIAHQILT